MSFDSAMGKLARAKHHLKAVKIQISTFMPEIEPTLIIADMGGVNFPSSEITDDGIALSAGNGHDALPLLVGDCVHNLRTSLDILSGAIVEAHGTNATENEIRFPVLEVGPTPNRQGRRTPPYVGAEIPVGIGRIIEAVQPYVTHPAGNFADSPLWLLHRLDIEDKHREVLLSTVRFQDIRVDKSYPAVTRMGRWVRIRSMDDGAEYALMLGEGDQDIYSRATRLVCFRPPGPGARKPITETLQRIVDYVEADIFTPLALHLS